MYKTKLKWGTVMSDPCISWLDIINKKSQFLFHGSTIVGTKTGIIYIIYIIYWQLKVICIHIIINLFKRDCVLKFGQMLYKDNGSRIWIHFEFVHMVTWAPIGFWPHLRSNESWWSNFLNLTHSPFNNAGNLGG